MADKSMASFRGEFFECAVNHGFYDYVVQTAENGSVIDKIYRETYARMIPGYAFHDINAIIRTYHERLAESGTSNEEHMSDAELADCFARFWMVGYDMAQRFILTMGGNPVSLHKPRRKKQKYSVTCLKLCLHTFCRLESGVSDPEYGLAVPSDAARITKELINLQLIAAGETDTAPLTESDACLYSGRGEFFNADTLLLVKPERSGEYCLFISDESIKTGDAGFCVRSPEDLDVAIATNVSDLKYKSAFRSIAVENIGSYDGINLNRAVDMAIDRELRKAVQAGSYAASFTGFLCSENLKPGIIRQGVYENIQSLVLVGKSAEREGVASFQKVKKADLDVFYKKYKELSTDDYANRADKQIKKLGKTMKYFDVSPDGKCLSKILYGTNTETADCADYRITDLQLRREHAEAVLEALESRDMSTIYLTGAPGIGKTTAILSFLKQEKCFFIYINPRTAISQDVMEKSVGENGVREPRAIAVTTDANAAGKICVTASEQAFSALGQINTGYEIEKMEERKPYGAEKCTLNAKRTAEKNISVSKQPRDETVMSTASGFMRSLLKNQMDKEIQDFDRITLTITIQACGKAKNLSEGIFKIFPFYRNDGIIDPGLAEAFAGKYSHIIFMIDEISGDDEGMSVLKELHNVVDTLRYEAPTIDTKLIVADASMQDGKTMETYQKGNLSESIFVNNTDGEVQNRLQTEKDRCVVNENTYPAKSLTVSYIPYHYDHFTEADGGIREVAGAVADFVYTSRKPENFLLMSDGIKRSRQCIVYRQNKDELRILEHMLKKKGICCEVMTSNTSPEAKEQLLKTINTDEKVEVILMTSSGARGISFKRVTKIFIFIPEFNFASNLMEIIQLAYRGRGDREVDENAGKELAFFIRETDTQKYAEKDRDSLRPKIEAINRLTTILLIQACIETRIYGTCRFIPYAVTPLGKQKKAEDRYDSNLYQLAKYAAKIQNANGEHRSADVIAAEVMQYCSTEHSFEGLEAQQALPSRILSGYNDRRYPGKPFSVEETGKLPFTVVNGFAVFAVRKAATNSIFAENRELKRKILLHEKNARKELAGQPDVQNALTEVISCLDKMSEADSSGTYSVNDRNSTRGYIAYPLVAFGKSFTREEWNNFTGKALAGNCKTILRTFADLNFAFPIGANEKYKDIPYIFFGSDDFEATLSRQYANTQLFVSNQTNILSLLFEN